MKKTKTPRFAFPQFFVKIFFVLVFLVGVAITAYPFYRDVLNDALGQRIVANYQTKENQKFLKEREMELKEKALADQQLKKQLADPFSEASLAEAKRKATTPTTEYLLKHTIALLYIPKIHQQLPIFDQMNDTFMDRGATWLTQTSFPSGGKGTHTVISAHRGLPSAKLFTDLPDLKNGDLFIIENAGKYLAYEVFQTQVVKPENTKVLKIEKGKEIATLLTCTPYMINSHRLLVTGKRVPFTPNMNSGLLAITSEQKRKKWLLITAIVLAVILAAIMFYYSLIRLLHSRKLYELTFIIEGATEDRQFQLFNRKGKKPMKRDGENITARMKKSGQVSFGEIPGIPYVVKPIRVADIFKISEIKFNIPAVKGKGFKPKMTKELKEISRIEEATLVIVLSKSQKQAA
jgi:sortase A